MASNTSTNPSSSESAPQEPQERQEQQEPQEQRAVKQQLHPGMTPLAGDVPGYWFRSPRTGGLSFVPQYMADTVERCMREGFTMEMDPAISGAPIVGEPKVTGDQLKGGTMSVTHIYH